VISIPVSQGKVPNSVIDMEDGFSEFLSVPPVT